MEQLNNIFSDSIENGILKMTISSPRKKDDVSKIKIRPVLLKGKMCYQKETFKNNQVFHSNLNADELLSELDEMSEKFRQFNWTTKQKEYTCLVSKKGKVTLKTIDNKAETCRKAAPWHH